MFVCMNMFVCMLVCICLYVCLCVYVCMYACVFMCYASPRRFSRVSLSGMHLRPHGLVIYDPTVESCQFIFFKNLSPLLPSLQTIKLPFVVIKYNNPQCYVSNYVQLLVTTYIFSLKFHNTRARNWYTLL